MPRILPPVFTPESSPFNDPDYIAVLLGRAYSSAQMLEAAAAILRLTQEQPGEPNLYLGRMRETVRHTRMIDALNRGRKWARIRLAERLSPLLETGIVVVVVPSHDPWRGEEAPIRQLAQDLAAQENRVDATDCLIRHTEIARIVFGGPSTAFLHRQTIRRVGSERIAGKRVLLLDDIAKSGQSMVACRALLYEAGAAVVQAAVLGRVLASDIRDFDD